MGRSRQSSGGRTPVERTAASRRPMMDPLVAQGASLLRDPPTTSDTEDESVNPLPLRALLMPPPIPGTANWGIPPSVPKTCDIELEVKLRRFVELKAQGVHFNQSLMSNKSFRNPHLYAKLVEFVEVDEGATNFPRERWNPHAFQKEWLAESIAEAQKLKYERLQTSQAPGKRSRIEFAPSSSSRDESLRSNARRDNAQSRDSASDDGARWTREESTGSRRRQLNDRSEPY